MLDGAYGNPADRQVGTNSLNCKIICLGAAAGKYHLRCMSAHACRNLLTRLIDRRSRSPAVAMPT